jgi:plastocyanin
MLRRSTLLPRASRIAIGMVLALAVALPATALAGAHAAASHHVTIKGYAFQPSHLSIRRGDTVTWLFQDGSIVHNVTGRGFAHSRTQSHGSFSVRFTRSGSFSYLCTLHTWMTGRIVVH